MSTRPLLVGELNTITDHPALALWPPTIGTAKRFCNILGIDAQEYAEIFDRINLCKIEWSNEAAKFVARMIVASVQDTIILLGRRVARAFHFDNNLLTIVHRDGKTYILLPHPSGRCRIWNDKKNIARARNLLHEAGILQKKEINK